MRKHLLTVLCCFVIIGAASAEIPSNYPKGPHGATLEKVQDQVFDTLQTTLEIPAGVDPAVWNARGERNDSGARCFRTKTLF